MFKLEEIRNEQNLKDVYNETEPKCQANILKKTRYKRDDR